MKNLDSSITDLVSESNKLYGILDQVSSSIRKLEESLRNSKTHVSFKCELFTENSTAIWSLKDEHIELCTKKIRDDAEGYYIRTVWFLSWQETEENSKNFRLYLLAEAKEILFHGFEEFYQEYFLHPQISYKKPFIETELEVRLRHSKYLISFINSFKVHLKKYREDIERNALGDHSFENLPL
jgi:hypothetical protein